MPVPNKEMQPVLTKQRYVGHAMAYLQEFSNPRSKSILCGRRA